MDEESRCRPPPPPPPPPPTTMTTTTTTKTTATAGESLETRKAREREGGGINPPVVSIGSRLRTWKRRFFRGRASTAAASELMAEYIL